MTAAWNVGRNGVSARHFAWFSPGWLGVSSGFGGSVLKRLRTHGLIKKVGHRYKYYLSKLGRRVVATTLVLREALMTPSLAQAVQSGSEYFAQDLRGKGLTECSERVSQLFP